jgi:D-amino-acid dehydrogenase
MSRTKSVVIVGGGVIGLCTAWYALQKGHKVTLVERGAPDHDCCSLGNAGYITPSHFVPLAAPGMVAVGMKMMLRSDSPFYVRPRLDRALMEWGWRFCRAANAAHLHRSAPLLRDLNLASRTCYLELADRFDNAFGLTTKGLLVLCKTEARLREEAEVAEMAHRIGLESEVLTPRQAAERDPNIRMDIVGAVYFAQDAHLIPQKFMAVLAQRLEQQGACIAWSTEVIDWRTEAGRIEAVLTDQGELSADEYVLAGGAWSPGIVRGLGLRLPMQAGKGYSLTLPRPRYLPALPAILAEARVAVTPMGETLRFGGTMEIAGLDTSINPVRVEAIRKAAQQYFPDLQPEDFHGIPPWSGLRPCSPDGLPYIGRFGRYSNLSAATGHAMMGLSLGPITGALMAEILSEEPPSLPIESLSPDRYA